MGDDSANSAFAFLRRGEGGSAPLLFAVNLTPEPRVNYRIGAPLAGLWRELLNTDAETYGGGNVGAGGRVQSEPVPAHGESVSLNLVLPPLGAVLLKFEDSTP